MTCESVNIYTDFDKFPSILKMKFSITALGLLAVTWTGYHWTPIKADPVHDLFELDKGCSNLWRKNMTTSYKTWHDDCEITKNIKITEEATMEHILPVYECILMDFGNYIQSTGMPIIDALKANIATDITGEDDWRYGIIDDVFSICITKEKVSEILHMSTAEFIEHNQCYWRIIDERCHADTHQKI